MYYTLDCHCEGAKRLKQSQERDCFASTRLAMTLIWTAMSLFIILILFPGLAYAKDDAASLTAKANRLYEEGKYDQALSLYNRALIVRPDSARLNFNAGAANYKKGDYEKAFSYFEKSALTEDKLLESKANYNSGNSQYKSAKLKEDIDLESAVNLMRQSMEHYKRAMELNNKDQDAKINYDIAEKELKAMLEKLKQNKGQCPNPQQSGANGQAKGDSDKQKAQSENKESQGENKEAQEAENKEAQEEDKQQAVKAAPEKAEEMSEQEARMLLEGQRQDENLGGQIRDAQKAGQEEVEKDW